jgi:hypothetical protein
MSQHDVFICYSSKDEANARRILAHVEERGFTCWISSRDVRPGRNYQESIVQAIEHTRIILFLFSENSNKTGEVKKELSLGSSFGKSVIPLRLSPIKPNGALQYELATCQWIDGFEGLEEALAQVVTAIEETLNPSAEREREKPPASRDRKSKSTTHPARAVPTPRSEPLPSAGSTEFEAIRSLLAHHVGPIAKILVERTAGDSRTRDEFCEKLAANVRAPADRAEFLRAVRAALPASP